MTVSCQEFTIIAEQLDLDRDDIVHNDHEPTIQVWSLMIHVFRDQDLITSWPTTVKEPLSLRERTEVDFYLNEILSSRSWPVKRAETTRKLINKYQKGLFTSLRVHQKWQPPQNEQYCLKLEILCNRKFLNLNDSATSQNKSIHSLYWELLEKLEIWSPQCPSSVVVRRRLDLARRTPGKDTKNIALNPISSLSQSRMYGSACTFNILLVVARDVTRHDRTGRCDPYGPTAIPAAVLKIQERLQASGSHLQVMLKVVRPGSLKVLKAILEKSSVKYNVVHFDMHGRVSEDTMHAELQFNINGDTQLLENWVDGKAIAEAMQQHQIKCVVIGACLSAYANATTNANLALLMVKRKISNVLAMSFKSNDKLSEEFFTSFYENLFIQQHELAKSAQLSRAVLLKEKRYRYYYGDSPGWKEVEDWFVPVVYSNGAPFFARNRRWELSVTQHSFLRTWWTLGVLYISSTTAVLMSCDFQDWHTNMAAAVMILLLLVSAKSFLAILRHRYQHRAASTGCDELKNALQESMKDKTNILRLENELNRIRKVYFYAHLNDRKVTPQKLLNHMLPIWGRTGFIDGFIRLDCGDFKQPLVLKSRLYEWHVRWHSFWAARELHEPQLMIIVDNIHELYLDPNDSDLFDARLLFEDWVRRVFPVGEVSQGGRPVREKIRQFDYWWWTKLIYGNAQDTTYPYLVLTGRNLDQSPNVIRNQLTTNFAQVPALRNIGITDFQKTDPFAISTERKQLKKIR